MRLFLIVVALIAPGACSEARPIAPGAIPVSAAARLDEGATVTVRGHLVFGSRARHLWHSREARRAGRSELCLTLVETAPHRDVLRRKSGSIVTIRGRIRSDVTSGYVGGR